MNPLGADTLRADEKENLFNPALHGLRGCAAILVVLYHIVAGAKAGQFLPESWPDLLLWIGLSFAHGVELFFIISGYLIVQSLVRHRTIIDFIGSRLLRIYPAYIPVLLVIFFAGPLAGYDYFNNVNAVEWIGLFFANLLFLPGIFPIEPALLVAWTLSYEAAFYAFCALALLTIQTMRSSVLAMMIIAAFSLASIIFYPIAVFFACGTACFLLRETLKPHASAFAPVSLLAFVVFFGALFLVQSPEMIQGLTLARTSVYVLWSLAIICGAILFLSLAYDRGPLAYILKTRFFLWLGTISYSLYLWHTPIMFGTKRLAIKLFEPYGNETVMLAFTISSLLLSVFIGWLSYVLCEAYIPKLLRGKVKWRSSLVRAA